MSKSIVPILRAGLAAYSLLQGSREVAKSSTRMARITYRRRAVPRKRYRSYAPIRTMMPRAKDSTMLQYSRYSTVTGAALVGGSVGFVQDITLSQAYTSDLASIYQFFRIMDVTAIITPRIDPGNSNVSPNHQVHAYVANDVAAEFNTVTSSNIPTQFSNQKYQCLVAGKSMYYKFWPKVTSAVDNNGVSVAVGAPGKINDWIKFNTAGTAIPHHRMIFWFFTPAPPSTQVIDIVYKINFQVRGLA